jgi:hypothetical protein
VPSPVNQIPRHRVADWLAIARTLLVEVLVLLALSVALIGYLRWSSDTSWAEFSSAGKSPVADAKQQPVSSTPVQTAKGQGSCPRKG